MPTFNGWSIVAMPATPAPASLEFSAVDQVALSTSPFTGQQQVQNWGGAWLEGLVTMPPMRHAAAQAWIAWLLSLQGAANVFQLGDPLARSPQGTGSGSPTVNGGGQTGTSLATAGWGGAGALLPGDWIQIGYRMYRNLGTVNGGGQTLSIWPPIRESPLNSTIINVFNTQGIFRLKSNVRKWSVGRSRLYGMSFEIREAI